MTEIATPIGLILANTTTLPTVGINPSSLPLVAKIAGFAISWATSIYFLWARNPPPLLSTDAFFPQVRAISIVMISIFLALSWGYLANEDGLQTLAVVAATVTVVGVVIFFLAADLIRRILRAAQAPDDRWLTGLLLAFLLYTSCISCGLTSAGVFLTVILSNQANAATGSSLNQPRSYDVRIILNGRTNLVENQESSFSTTSGQANFGCGDAPTVRARFRVPSGAVLIGQPVASW
jgi:hypothetical protein